MRSIALVLSASDRVLLEPRFFEIALSFREMCDEAIEKRKAALRELALAEDELRKSRSSGDGLEAELGSFDGFKRGRLSILSLWMVSQLLINQTVSSQLCRPPRSPSLQHLTLPHSYLHSPNVWCRNISHSTSPSKSSGRRTVRLKFGVDVALV